MPIALPFKLKVDTKKFRFFSYSMLKNALSVAILTPFFSAFVLQIVLGQESFQK